MRAPTTGSMTRLAQLLGVAFLAATLAACGGSGGSGAVTGEPISFEELSQAAQSSADATSGRFAFAFEVSAPELEQALGLSGEGAFDQASGRASFSADLSSFMTVLGGLLAGFAGEGAPDFDDPALWKVETVREGSVTYLRFPAIDDQLPAGKTWVRVADGEVAKAGGFELREFDQFTQADPAEFLELLRSVSGELETVGVESVRGAETTHYRATLDAESLTESVPADQRDDVGALADRLVEQSGISEVPLDVWVDANGLVRKIAVDVTATQPGQSEPSEASISFELWDFGEAVDVALPPASQVADASQLKR